jgi:hypothetical protein
VIVPSVVDQRNVGCVAKATRNWSNPVAVNGCVPAALRLTVDGLSVAVVSVWVTVTPTVLVIVWLPASVIVTVKA